MLDAAKRLNYVPNLNARSLSSRHTNLIGVVIPQTEPGKEFMFSNPFYGELLSASSILPVKAAITCFCPAPARIRTMRASRRTGAWTASSSWGTYPGENLDALRTIGVPIVLVDSYVTGSGFHTIGIKDREGARMATQYLIDKGHRDIAFISGSIREHGVNSSAIRDTAKPCRRRGCAFPRTRCIWAP